MMMMKTMMMTSKLVVFFNPVNGDLRGLFYFRTSTSDVIIFFCSFTARIAVLKIATGLLYNAFREVARSRSVTNAAATP
jgi:hypothetical protein